METHDTRPISAHFGQATWAAALCGAALLAVQTALAGTDALTLRYAASFALTLGAALVAARGARSDPDPAPDPTALVLGAAAGLSIFAVAWWGMDLADHLLRLGAGALPSPRLLSRDADRLLGADLRAASYELAVLGGVGLIPWAQSWLLWGLLRRDLVARVGAGLGVWLAGLLGGCVLALSASQQVEPSLPSGLASLPGYLLVGVVAAWAAALGGSFWAGFAAQGAFAYASLALRDDLLRALGGRDYLDPAWLTAIVLGVFGAAVALQVMRFRAEPPAPQNLAEPDSRPALPALVAIGVVVGALIALVAIDLARRG